MIMAPYLSGKPFVLGDPIWMVHVHQLEGAEARNNVPLFEIPRLSTTQFFIVLDNQLSNANAEKIGAVASAS